MNNCMGGFQRLVGKWPVAVACFSFAAFGAQAANASDLSFGKPGEAVQLVVGYQPYYTQSWSGVVMRGKEFWKKYLPKGSTVEFQVGLQGAIIVNAMLAGKQYIGYMGDMPAIVATTKQDVADVRIVANLGLGHDQCNIFLAKKDAPQFKSPQEALQWLNEAPPANPLEAGPSAGPHNSSARRLRWPSASDWTGCRRGRSGRFPRPGRDTSAGADA